MGDFMVSRISRLLLLCILSSTLCNALDFEKELRNRAQTLTNATIAFVYIDWLTDQAQKMPAIKTRRSNIHWNLKSEFCTPIDKILAIHTLTPQEKHNLVIKVDKLVALYSNGPVDPQAIKDLKTWQARIHNFAGELQDDDVMTMLPAAHPAQPIIEFSPETQEVLEKFQKSYLRLAKEIIALDARYVHRNARYEREVTQEKARINERMQRTHARLTRQLNALGRVTVNEFKDRLKAEHKLMKRLARQLPQIYPLMEAASERARTKFVAKLAELRQNALAELDLTA